MNGFCFSFLIVCESMQQFPLVLLTKCDSCENMEACDCVTQRVNFPPALSSGVLTFFGSRVYTQTALP